MKTLKKYVSEKSSKSSCFSEIIRYYKKEDLIKIALFCVEDCLHLSSSQQDIKDCIDIIKKWLKDPFSVKRKELKDVANKP